MEHLKTIAYNRKDLRILKSTFIYKDKSLPNERNSVFPLGLL